MEQKKAVCGGFYIGDGLEMDGKTLKATGGIKHLLITENDDGSIVTIHNITIEKLWEERIFSFDYNSGAIPMRGIAFAGSDDDSNNLTLLATSGSSFDFDLSIAQNVDGNIVFNYNP